MVKHVSQRVGLAGMARLGEQMNNYLGIGRGLEYTAIRFVFVPQKCRIYDITVMCHCHLPVGILTQKRLIVNGFARTRSRIPNMANGYRIGKLLQKSRTTAENPSDHPRPCITMDEFAIAGGDSRRFLSAVLKTVQPEVGFLNSFGVAEYAEKTAVLSWLVLHFYFYPFNFYFLW